MKYPKLTIRHNFGVMRLIDAEIVDGIAVGTIESGGETSRLLGHTLNKPYPTGERGSFPVYQRTPSEMSDGSFYMDVCFC